MSNEWSIQPPLRVFVLWHPLFERGKELAEGLYRGLCCDTEQLGGRALRIPVRFRCRAVDGENVPRDVELDAGRTAVIVLVDDEMVNDSEWEKYVGQIHSQCQVAGEGREGFPRHRVFPVALCDAAYKVESSISAINFIRLEELSESQHPVALLNGVMHELARLMLDRPRAGDEERQRAAGPAPVRVFISHAKRDGVGLSQAARDYLAWKTQLDSFFDVHDIPAGSEWKNVLKEEAGSGINALLVLQTDAYSTREWCRIEVLQAKLASVPMLVVQAVSHAEDRSFPYLGNVPAIRWIGDDPNSTELWDRIIGRLLVEVLRAAYFPRWVEYVAKLHEVEQPLKSLSHPPELLSLIPMQRHERDQRGTVFVYPDPPLGTEELEILQEAAPELRIVTPVQLPLLLAREEQT